ncbi:hypothetical protein KR018_010939 [Drosophila ironensis]|nr:hypothetical protein KR018_010939 [Drosophila ironensis]
MSKFVALLAVLCLAVLAAEAHKHHEDRFIPVDKVPVSVLGRFNAVDSELDLGEEKAPAILDHSIEFAEKKKKHHHRLETAARVVGTALRIATHFFDVKDFPDHDLNSGDDSADNILDHSVEDAKKKKHHHYLADAANIASIASSLRHLFDVEDFPDHDLDSGDDSADNILDRKIVMVDDAKKKKHHHYLADAAHAASIASSLRHFFDVEDFPDHDLDSGDDSADNILDHSVEDAKKKHHDHLGTALRIGWRIGRLL